MLQQNHYCFFFSLVFFVRREPKGTYQFTEEEKTRAKCMWLNWGTRWLHRYIHSDPYHTPHTIVATLPFFRSFVFLLLFVSCHSLPNRSRLCLTGDETDLYLLLLFEKQNVLRCRSCASLWNVSHISNHLTFISFHFLYSGSSSSAWSSAASYYV